MKKIDTVIRFWYPLFFGMALFISVFVLRFYIREGFIYNKLNELDGHTLYFHRLVSKNHSQNKKANINNSLKAVQVKILPFSDILFLGLKGQLCLGKLADNPLSITDCSNQGHDLLYNKEIQAAKNHVFGYDIRYHTHNEQKKQYLYFARKFKEYYIKLTVPYTDITESLSRIDSILLICSVLGLIIIILTNSYLARMIVKPILEIIQFSKRYKENLSSRLPYAKTEEISRLQSALNTVANDVQKQLSELAYRKNQVETIIKNVSDGVLILDQSLKVLLYNAGLFSLLNIDSEVYHDQIDGKYYYEIIRNNLLNKLIERSANEEKRFTNNISLATMENKILEVTCIPLPNKTGVVIFINDITEQYKLIEIKKSFVENVSHEFKTPISIIKGYLETLLKAKKLSFHDQKRFLLKVLKNADRLSNLINDLITLNKLDESKDYFRKEKVNVINIIENCLDILSLKAEEKGVHLINSITEETIENICNPELWEIIFYNLIDNGITYNEQGGELKVSFEEKGGQLIFMISDSGIGVSSENRERIFERFYRVDEGRSRKSGGTGLGLSIVKHAVLFHDGEILCEPNPEGRGTLFKVIIPSTRQTDIDFINSAEREK